MEMGTNWKGGGGGSLELPRLYLNEFCLYSSIFGSKLELRVSYKGSNATEPLLDPLKTNGTKRTPL